MPVIRPISVSVCPTPATDPAGVSTHQGTIVTARPSQNTARRTTRPAPGLIAGPAGNCNRVIGRDLAGTLVAAPDSAPDAGREGRPTADRPSSQPSGAGTGVISRAA